MICKPNLDLNDSMSAFEIMDPKMDGRMHRKLIVTPKQAQMPVPLPKDQLLKLI